MKKIISLISLFLLISVSSYAQEWYGGPIGSGNLTTLSGLNDTKFKFGGQIGGFVGYDFNSWFGLEARLLYSYEGTAVEMQEANTVCGISYIKLPIFAKFTVVKGLYLGVAPDMKYKIGESNWKNSAEFNNFNIGIEGIIGYQLDCGLRIEAGYSHMFTKCLTGFSGGDFVKNYQEAITLGIAWRF